MHGKTDMISHNGRGLFAGLDNPFQATRYHSLVIKPDTLPAEFEVTAWSDNPAGGREIMAVQHKQPSAVRRAVSPGEFSDARGLRHPAGVSAVFELN